MTASLAITRLDLQGVRNLADQRLTLDPKQAIALIGPNGAGKTNLLEAVSLLSPGRGVRRAKFSDIACSTSDENPPSKNIGGWNIAAKVTFGQDQLDIGVGWEPGTSRKQARIDGTPARSQIELGQWMNVLWLIPAMDRLFMEGPQGRRRFLDRLVFGFDPAHAGRIQSYEQAVRQRLRLLLSATENSGNINKADPRWLDALETEIATRGTSIAAARQQMAARLEQACQVEDKDHAAPFPSAHISVCGQIEDWLLSCPSVEVETRFKDQLTATRAQDAAHGTTACGPHRSDMRVVYARKNIAAENCSTGEQKALLVGMTLAAARLQTAERGTPPLLLLDEVAAHLDPQRRAALYERLYALGGQIWMTGTEPALFDDLKDGQSIQVKAGKILV